MNDSDITIGSGNVFADLGYSDAPGHKLKAGLIRQIAGEIKARGLTQSRAAALMGIGQPDLSRLLSGRFRDFSSDRLFGMLTRLDVEVDVVIRPRDDARRHTIHLGG